MALDEALHYDSNKPRWELAPWRAFNGVIEVLTYGCKKYAERNWEKGMRFSRLFASTMRHMLQWWFREDLDSESGLHHLKHAATDILMIIDYIERGLTAYDDRPTGDSTGSNTVASQDTSGLGKSLDALVEFAKPECGHLGLRYYRFEWEQGDDRAHRVGPYCDDCRERIEPGVA